MCLKGTNHKRFVPHHRMSNLLVHVQDGLETTEQRTQNIYMLFAGWEVRMVKNCDRGL